MLFYNLLIIEVFYGGGAYFDYSVLPTIYLKPDIALSGNGTLDDPYTIN